MQPDALKSPAVMVLLKQHLRRYDKLRRSILGPTFVFNVHVRVR